MFDAPTGWTPVNTPGTVWRYRARGVFGVLYFKTIDGQRTYEATHQDSRSNDTAVTTVKRKPAVRFAMTGSTKRPRKPG